MPDEYIRRAGDTLETARELATHASEIKHLQNDMDKVVKDMEEIKLTLVAIEKTLSEAKGGWHTLMLVGGCAATIGAIITWSIDFLHK